MIERPDHLDDVAEDDDGTDGTVPTVHASTGELTDAIHLAAPEIAELLAKTVADQRGW